MKIPASFVALKALLNGKPFIATRQVLKDRRLAKVLVRKFGSSISEQEDAINAFKMLHTAKAEHDAKMLQRPIGFRTEYMPPADTTPAPFRKPIVRSAAEVARQARIDAAIAAQKAAARAHLQPKQSRKLPPSPPAEAEVGGYVPMSQRKITRDV